MFGQLRKLTARLSPQRSKPVRVAADSEGIFLEEVDSSSKRAIPWQKIVRVTAFKRDVYIHDLICLLIQSDAGVFELNEGMEGWQETVQVLDTFLPSAVPYPQWLLHMITSPAFEPTPIEVYATASAGVSG